MKDIISHFIYGDFEEMPLSVLGEECPSLEEYAKMDVEQQLRLQVAATLIAYKDNKLHKGGYLFDEKIHKKEDLIAYEANLT